MHAETQMIATLQLPRVFRAFFLLLALGAFSILSESANALTCFDHDITLPDGVNSETGFRMERYRSPVPDSIPGGCIATTSEVEKAHQAIANGTPGWLFLDVYPPKGMGADPMTGDWLNSEIHETIEGSVWLPEVGRGYVESEHIQFFEANLEQLTAGNEQTPLLFFCTADCWQSWNAAVRAIELGYTNVIWYPEGTDGWREAGLNLVVAEPVNFFAHAREQEKRDAEKSNLDFPTRSSIVLIGREGEETTIGSVEFSKAEESEFTAIKVNIESDDFTDHFLSMRPFRCLENTAEWFCYLDYPYKLKQIISKNDLTDLEYQLLFIKKTPGEFGIDAWNGLYYKLALADESTTTGRTTETGIISGQLLEGDLNVLQSPPDTAFDKPIDLGEFIEADKNKRLYPTIEIRPVERP